MHSKRMYLGLQSTRILVGFLRVAAASSAVSVYALVRGWRHDKRFLVKCVLSEKIMNRVGLIRDVARLGGMD